MLKESSHSKSTYETGGSISIPKKNQLQPTLLHFGPPLIITESVERVDEFRRKTKNRSRQKSTQNTKTNIAGLGKIGTPMINLCLGHRSHNCTNKILKQIHSPRDGEQRGHKVRQEISNACSTRVEAVRLKEELDKRLKEFGVEEVGFCRKRSELFSQCFDEIIRQVSISCTDRGKLLMEVRDEVNLMFSSYESLFYSAMAYGIRKQLKCQNNIEEWEKNISDINDEMMELIEIYNEFSPTYEHFQEKFDTQSEADERDYKLELERLQNNNRILKNLLLKAVHEDTPEESAFIS